MCAEDCFEEMPSLPVQMLLRTAQDLRGGADTHPGTERDNFTASAGNGVKQKGVCGMDHRGQARGNPPARDPNHAELAGGGRIQELEIRPRCEAQPKIRTK